MIFQSGIVSEIRGDIARVEIFRSGICSACAGDRGCGLGPILAMFNRTRSTILDIDLPVQRLGIEVGDAVRIAISGQQLLVAAGLAYLLPLSGMLVGAWLATRVVPGGADISAICGAVIGALGTSQLLARGAAARLHRYLRGARVERLKPADSSAR
jgi:sigma-E factor negative regulatory protein RseC